MTVLATTAPAALALFTPLPARTSSPGFGTLTVRVAALVLVALDLAEGERVRGADHGRDVHGGVGGGFGVPGRTVGQSVDALCTHIDHIHDVAKSLDHVGIGSDLDGWIKPALTGLGHLGHMAALQAALRQRYGEADAETSCSGNSVRILTTAWDRGFASSAASINFEVTITASPANPDTKVLSMKSVKPLKSTHL